MIKADKGTIEICGTRIELITELTLIVRDLKKTLIDSGMPKEFVDKFVSDAIKTADMNREEIIKGIIDFILKKDN